MKEFLKANKGCVLAIVLISPVVVAFFEYIFYYHVQYRTENVKCVYDIIGAGLQTCLYQMAVIFIPFTPPFMDFDRVPDCASFCFIFLSILNNVIPPAGKDPLSSLI